MQPQDETSRKTCHENVSGNSSYLSLICGDVPIQVTRKKTNFIDEMVQIPYNHVKEILSFISMTVDIDLPRSQDEDKRVKKKTQQCDRLNHKLIHSVALTSATCLMIC